MLELGKAGSAGTARGEHPVLQDGTRVATMRASNWRESATAVVSDREWRYGKHRRALTGRWAIDPEDHPRLSARQRSFWTGSWDLDLEGTAVEMRPASWWRGTHRYLAGDRQVAESGTTGPWSSRPTLTADPSMPLDHQVFLLWVERVLSRRRSDAAAAASAGGTN